MIDKPEATCCHVCERPFKPGQVAFYQEARVWEADWQPSDPVNQVWVTCSKTCARKAVASLDAV